MLLPFRLELESDISDIPRIEFNIVNSILLIINLVDLKKKTKYFIKIFKYYIVLYCYKINKTQIYLNK